MQIAPTIDEMLYALSQHEVFADLDNLEQQQLAGLLSFQTVEKDTCIFKIEDPPEHLFYLLHGSMTLYFPDATFVDLEKNELIGEIGVLNGDFRLGRLIATDTCNLIKIKTNQLFNDKLLSPITSLKILRKLSKRVTNYLRSIQQTTTREIISIGENEHVEFKAALRWNMHAKKNDSRITYASLKTVAAFLNTHGGTLIVGVTDDGQVCGLENDDKTLLFITNVIKSNIGPLFLDFIYFNLEILDGHTILRVDVQPSSKPCYLKEENAEHFYIRTGPSTTDLSISKVHEYINRRFE